MTPPLRATYRLQFHRDFPFAAAEAIVPYLARLGVSHVYASPILAAVPGSMHGYDAVDPNLINPELGGAAGFEALAAALAANGLGLILDVVPNHMAASSHNPYWMETLEFGPAAPAAALFDIWWEAGRLLLPVLGDPLRATLEERRLRLRADWEAGRFVVAYAEHAFPLGPVSVSALLEPLAHREGALAPLAGVWAALASGNVHAPAIAAAREAMRVLPEAARERVEEALAGADLAALLETQHWRLAWWRTAADELNYRRFFNITDLVGVRVEDPAVFEATHALILSLVRRGLVQGLRIDHVDGLVDPAGYLERLRAAVGPDVPVFVEKILEPGEVLPAWPIDGTTGYERLNDINALFVDEAGYRAFEAELRAANLLRGTTGERVAAAKREIMRTSLGAELSRLVGLVREGLREEMERGDITEGALARAVLALLVHCPVYRSYATDHAHDPADTAIWAATLERVEAHEDPMTVAAARLLLKRLEKPEVAGDRAFRRYFQQVSGPAMAKGFEDTELYRTPILVSVNEVGGDLDHPAREPGELRRLFAARARMGACDLVPLETHDTKRGPETRARLNALSHRPALWRDFLREAAPTLARLREKGEGGAVPDGLEERLIHQTLIATWPITMARLEGYLLKALREAKRHTTWETPDQAYEAAVLRVAGELVEGAGGEDYRRLVVELVARLAPATHVLSLAQTALQLTLPGTPDIYQGTEFRDFSLVDPDNRRPVDFERRLAALSGEGEPEDVEKCGLTHRLLGLRRDLGCFSGGGYRPLDFAPSPWHWFGFVREGEGDAVLVVVPTRVPEGVPPEMTALEPPAGFRDLEGRQVSLAGHMLEARLPLLVALRRG
ncbi:malto-oligosyltrehalose synthase [Ancylobacter mangrovi]|uniref:malto-oligosyltrehalose synthase n=1 Tax=Ancylobacter mangrovi TaxID=2972472 RepID=UPI002161D6A4|nr:malto-oligosyltrehalose synthase [Ancylobacter mangrovi]MCS0502237.1 malto-oligosyltrehalose synthase [Ancylobacter mangrovi]